jgi:hypothetical protein
MCTMIAKQVKIDGSGRGAGGIHAGGNYASGINAGGWFTVSQANISYDHPFNAPLEHALNIDFVNEELGLGARVAVELSAEAARSLVEAILEVLKQAEAGGHL